MHLPHLLTCLLDVLPKMPMSGHLKDNRERQQPLTLDEALEIIVLRSLLHLLA